MNTTDKVFSIDTEKFLAPKPQTPGKLMPVYGDDHPAMKQRASEFDFSAPQIDAKELAASLLLTMQRHNGLGLAAPQCGIPLRVFAMSTGDVCFNPSIHAVHEKTVRVVEGCLSFPGLMLPITRPESIEMKWFDVDGNEKSETFSGLTARVIQHEYDHLDGIVFTTKVGSLTLQMAKKKRKKLLKKIERYQNSVQQQLKRTLSIKAGE